MIKWVVSYYFVSILFTTDDSFTCIAALQSKSSEELQTFSEMFERSREPLTKKITGLNANFARPLIKFF